MDKWWINYHWRLIQTNLREIDFKDLDPVRYVESLKEFNATVVMLNACGIISNYDTSIKDTIRNSYAKEEVLKEIIDLCHKNNIKVIARTDFSKVRYQIYLNHPDWAVRTYDGNIINYNDNVHICPNSYYHEQVKLDMLKELFNKFEFDGLFCNMGGFLSVDYSYNYYGPCYCDNCKRKYKAMFNEDMPSVGRELSPSLIKILKFQSECTKKHKMDLINHIRSINPNIAINGVDYIREESNTDLNTPYFEYSASSNSRLASLNDKLRPSDNACVDFMGFRYRHSSISKYQMAYRSYQNLANAGSASLYIMGSLDNHIDKSCFDEVKTVFNLHKKYEDFYSNMSSASETLLVRRKSMSRIDDEGNGFIKILTELHIPFDEINLNEIDEKSLKNIKNVIVYDNKNIPSDKKKLLDDFVSNGGNLVATFDTTSLDSLGIKQIVEKRKCLSSAFLMDDKFTYSNESHIIPFGDDYYLCDYNDDVIKYNKFVEEHPFGPPEICYYNKIGDEPSVTLNNYGLGKGIYIPSKIASFYNREGHLNSLNFFKDVLFNIMNIKPISSSSEMIEFTVMNVNDNLFIQLVNGSGHFSNSYFKPVPIYDIDLDIDLEKYDISNIQTLNGGSVKVSNEKLYLDKLNSYEGILIKRR